MLFLDILFFVIGSCLISYSESGRIRRVVGGSPAEHGGWPFLVSLSFKEAHPFKDAMGLPHLCAGTLISQNLVLSAAHCFQVEEYPRLAETHNWEAVVGEHHREQNDGTEQVMSIESITKHEDFTLLPTKNDIAILKLTEPVEINDYAVPVNLDSTGQYQINDCKVIGWGQPDAVQYGLGTTVPHEAELSIVDIMTCNEMYESSDYSQYFDIDDTIICATGNGDAGTLDACLGDSGGPLICKHNNEWVQTGIVSGGVGCGNPAFPGLYTNLHTQSQWILNKVRELSAEDNVPTDDATTGEEERLDDTNGVQGNK